MIIYGIIWQNIKEDREMKKHFKSMAFLLAVLAMVLCTVLQPHDVRAATPKLNKTRVTLVKGGQTKLKVTGTAKAVKWSTDKKKIATVSSKGVVKAKGKGTARITAKIGKKKLVCRVTVETPKLNRTSLTLDVGKTATLKLSGTKGKITWSTTDKSVATVTQKGVVRGAGAGNCRVRAEANGGMFFCAVAVNEPTVKSFDIHQLSITVSEDKTEKIRYSIYPRNATNKNLAFFSSDESIATVSKEGVVKGIHRGTCEIKAVCGGISVSRTVYVVSGFSENEARKALTYESFVMDNLKDGGVLVVVKNNYKYAMSIDARCKFYDNSGNLVGDSGTSLGENHCLEPGRESFFYVKGPYKPDDYEVYFDIRENYFSGNAGGIEIVSSELKSGNVVAKVKNNSSISTQTWISCIFYKDEVPIGFNHAIADVDYVGAESDTVLYTPNGINKEDINNYKLNIEFSCAI